MAGLGWQRRGPLLSAEQLQMNESPMGERELDTAPTSSPKLWPAEEDAEARPVSARSPKAREENVARHMPQAGFLERQMPASCKDAGYILQTILYKYREYLHYL